MRTPRSGAALLAAVLVLLAGCGGDDGATPTTSTAPAASATSAAADATVPSTAALTTTTGGPATVTAAPSPTTAAPSPPSVAAPVTVPAGTTLRIADQYGLFQGMMGFAGLDQDIPYDVEYVTLSPGPLQLQAFQADEVDFGVVSPMGLIQAAAGGVDLHAVARWRTDFALYAVVTAPGVPGIDSWEDLRGKRVAFQRYTMSEALLLLNLDRAGMSLDDITVVDIPHHEVGTALQGGHADFGVSSEPFISAYLAANPTATYAFGIEEPLAQSTILVARDDALSDPAVSAAITEYVQRLDRAFVELTSDRDAFAALAAEVWHLDRTYIDRVLAQSEGVHVEGVPGDLVAPYERLLQLLAAQDLIDADLTVEQLFDPRFDALLAE